MNWIKRSEPDRISCAIATQRTWLRTSTPYAIALSPTWSGRACMRKTQKELARHSTITLTMDRYAHVGLRDTASALAKVSHRATSITSEAMKQDASTDDQEGLNLPPNLPPASDNSRLQLGSSEEEDTPKSLERSRTKQLKNKPRRANEN